MKLHSEILEQPQRLETLLTAQHSNVEKIAEEIRSRNVAFAYLAARGTSDNAGRYANYVWGAFNGIPMALATPSLFTYYHQPVNLKNALVVGISQSGQSPDIISVLQEGKKQGNLTLAITNAPDSPLAQMADFVLNIESGPELAVAATKTYTGELMAIAMLSAALTRDKTHWQELVKVPEWIGKVLEQEDKISQAAQRYRFMQQCVILGRGYNYASAFEWALKLKELTYTEAEPYSSADFQHGPVAMVDQGYPIFAIAPKGSVHDSMVRMLENLKTNLQAELVVISNSKDALKLAQIPFTIPSETPEWLSPLVSIVVAQLFACHLTVVKGYDPDQPRTIHKITETR
ncbi:MAG: glucosamine--fructose-6-phosphate aminotransferase [Anaerolinea sp.]|nr:glucosamine--fructose-6-phosphate aminotransferase [Anaerolinea sp.]